MKSHVFRPLIVVIAFVVIILVARTLFVPDSFGTHEMGYRFGWHDKQNEDFWRDGFQIKYVDRELCMGCHGEKAETLLASPHKNINCQNCHAAEGVVGYDHPEKIDKMVIDRSRLQCLRCHASIPDIGSGRAKILKQINDKEHNTGYECADCHDPHSPGL